MPTYAESYALSHPDSKFIRVFLNAKRVILGCLLASLSYLGSLFYFQTFYDDTRSIHLKPTHPDFVGRAQPLIALKHHFQLKDRKSGVLSVLLLGEGGVGKTELAIKFCNTHLSSFSFVSWIDCSSNESYRTSYIALGEFLGVSIQKSESDRALISKVHDHLKNKVDKKPWLIVFDNADASCALPLEGNGRILITSRTSQPWEAMKTIEVSPFTEKETVALFKKIAPKFNPKHTSSLGEEFGFFPLALNQIAHFIHQNPRMSLESCLSLVKKKELAAPNKVETANGHPLKLSSSWGVSHDAIKKQNPQALEWAQFCSFLHPENIPQTWIIEWLMKFEMIEDRSICEAKASEIVQTLKDYSIIRYNHNNDSFSLHRLSQEVLQSDAECLLQKEAALAYLVHYPSSLKGDELEDNISDWENLEIWNHHASWFLNHYISSEKVLHVGAINQLLGKYKYLIGNYKSALQLLEEAKEIKRHFYEDESVQVSTCNHLLGVVLERLGKYEHAEKVLTQALDFRRNIYGSDHQKVASSSHSLGWVLVKLGEFKKAKELFLTALATREALFGKDNPYYATTLNYLSWTLFKLGDYNQAKSLAIEALEIRKKIFKGCHPSIARSMNDLGVILGKMGEYELSANYHLKAWQMREALFGSIHPDISHSIYDLAVVYEKWGKLAEAKEVQKKALKMKYALFDANHPEVANSLHALGIIHIKLNELEEAQVALSQSSEIRKNTFPENHPKNGDSQLALGLLFERQGQDEKALQCYENAYRIRCQALGEEHRDTLEAKKKIQNIQQNQRKDR